MKGNLFQGAGFGKLGDVVFYRMDGVQMARQRIRRIANPKSAAQAANRALVNTLSAAYSALQGICDHSFQGFTRVVDNQREFLRRNQAVARATGSVSAAGTDTGYNFNFKGENLLRPNPYVISRGTAPELPVGLDLGSPVALDGVSYDEAISMLGLQRGDQITTCMIVSDGDSVSSGKFVYSRVIMTPANGDYNTPFLSQNVLQSPNPLNQGVLMFDEDFQPTYKGVHFYNTDGQTTILAAGYIVSRYANGKWLRSNCQMVVSEAAQDSNTMSEVYNSYMETEADVVSTEYLNGAGNVLEEHETSTQGSVVTVESVTLGGTQLSTNSAGAYVGGDLGGELVVSFKVTPYKQLAVTSVPAYAGATITSNPSQGLRTITQTVPAPSAGRVTDVNITCGDKHVLVQFASNLNG